jgi:hypothetical protein
MVPLQPANRHSYRPASLRMASPPPMEEDVRRVAEFVMATFAELPFGLSDQTLSN